MVTTQAVGRSAVWASVEAIGGAVLRVASLVVLARLLAPEDFGVAMLAIAIVYPLNTLVQGFFEYAIVQRADIEATHLDTAFWTALGAAAIITPSCWLVADSLAAVFGEPALAPVLRWMCPVLVFGSFSGVTAAQSRRALEFRPVAVAMLVGRVLSAVCAVSAALAGLGVWSFAAQQLGLFGGRAVTLWVLAGWRPRRRFSCRHLRELCQFAIPSTASRTLRTGNDHLFFLLAGHLFGSVGLGYVSLATRLSGSVSDVIALVSRQVSLSVMARQQHARHAMRQSVYRATSVTWLLALLIFIGVMVCAEPMVLAVFGQHWSAAVPIVRLFAMASILNVAIEPVRAAVDAVGRPAWHLVRGSAELGLEIGGLLLLAPIGIVATGIVMALSAVLTRPIDFLVARRLVQLDGWELVRRMHSPLAAALAMAAVIGTAKMSLMAEWTAATTLLTLGAVTE